MAPVKVSVAPGISGTPSRIASERTRASGPAQSVSHRLQWAFVDRMFMKMSGAPWAWA